MLVVVVVEECRNKLCIMDIEKLTEPMIVSKSMLFTNKTCLICCKGIDELNLGVLHNLQVFSVHYLCLVTGVGLYATGKAEGLLGFLLSDIYRAYKRYTRKTCAYCLKFGASLYCYTCQNKYHLPCGLQNGIHIEMVGSYRSTCRSCNNFVLRGTPKNIKTYSCGICFDTSAEECDKVYWPICCKPELMIHFDCLRTYALTAGFLTKCPLCADRTYFRMSIKKFGVYIPNQDAAWLKKGAENIVSYPLKCCAKACLLNADDTFSTVLIECLVCEQSVAHEECTFCGIFVCCKCTQDLWPNGVEEKELTDDTESFGITFPWFFYLIGTVKYGKPLLGVVKNVLELLGKKLQTGESVKWNELLDAQETKLITKKLIECRNNYLATKKRSPLPSAYFRSI